MMTLSLGHSIPSPTMLSAFIESIPSYPTSVEDILAYAAATGVDQAVCGFYRCFAPGVVFSSRDDLMVLTEQVELLEEQDTSDERLATYEAFDSH